MSELAKLNQKLDRLISLQEQLLEVQKVSFLNMDQFAARVGVSVDVIKQKCLRLQLAHRKEGKSVLIPVSELERWMQEAEDQRIVDEKFKTRRNRLINKNRSQTTTN